MQYAGWFRHEIRSIYEQLRAAGVPVREMITEDVYKRQVYDGYLQITGYCKCCVDCDFIEEKDADELMHLAAYLAGNEQARTEAQQKAGKKE